MQALVVGEVGRHSWEQSPLLWLHRLVPGITKTHAEQNQRGAYRNASRCSQGKQAPCGNHNNTSSIKYYQRHDLISAEQTGSKEKNKTSQLLSCTFLHCLVVDFHVHHGGRAVAQDFPVAAVLLVADPDLVSALIGPPQLLS